MLWYSVNHNFPSPELPMMLLGSSPVGNSVKVGAARTVPAIVPLALAPVLELETVTVTVTEPADAYV